MITQSDWVSAQSGDTAARNKILIQYQDLVEYCANSLSKGMPSHIDKQDLISCGQFGLIDAISRFDYERGLQFETFAAQRIRGAILDELRAQDWVPRSVRSRERRVSKAIESAAQSSGASLSDQQISEITDLSVDQVVKARATAELSQVYALDMQLDDSDSGFTLADTVTSDIGDLSSMFENLDPEAVADALSALDEKEAMVIALHYYLGKSLAEIGRQFGVTESRVCQIHTKALKSIRGDL